jgi:hypothetical protein
MAASMPAMAKPGQGGGKGAAKTQTQGKGRTGTVSDGKARTDSRAAARARARTGASVDRTRDVDRDGIPDYRDRVIGTARALDRNGDGIDDRTGRRYAGADCPPGLAKKTPRCVPPGQAKRMWQQGQRLPAGYRDYLSYEALQGRLPEAWRDDIPTGDYRYIYRDNSVYVVNPRTRLVERIIDIVL